MFTGRKVRISH